MPPQKVPIHPPPGRSWLSPVDHLPDSEWCAIQHERDMKQGEIWGCRGLSLYRLSKLQIGSRFRREQLEQLNVENEFGLGRGTLTIRAYRPFQYGIAFSFASIVYLTVGATDSLGQIKLPVAVVQTAQPYLEKLQSCRSRGETRIANCIANFDRDATGALQKCLGGSQIPNSFTAKHYNCIYVEINSDIF